MNPSKPSPSLNQHPLPNIDVQIDPDLADSVPAKLLTSAAATALRHLDQDDAEVTLVISNDQLLRQLNRSYRGIDSPTDVLSFSAREESESASVTFVSAPEAAMYLGDVVISLPAAQRQAKESGHGLEHELCLLVVHGVLHLLGFDHANPDDEAVMEDLQRNILAAMGIQLP